MKKLLIIGIIFFIFACTKNKNNSNIEKNIFDKIYNEIIIKTNKQIIIANFSNSNFTNIKVIGMGNQIFSKKLFFTNKNKQNSLLLENAIISMVNEDGTERSQSKVQKINLPITKPITITLKKNNNKFILLKLIDFNFANNNIIVNKGSVFNDTDNNTIIKKLTNGFILDFKELMINNIK